MRRLVLLIVLMFGGVAYAQPAEPPISPMSPKSPTLRQREQLTGRPSGFWTSTRPAEGGRYKWRLLGLGVGIAGVTGFFMVRLVRRASAERKARS